MLSTGFHVTVMLSNYKRKTTRTLKFFFFLNLLVIHKTSPDSPVFVVY